MFSKLSTIILDENKVARRNLASIIRHNLDIKDIKLFENVNLLLHYLKSAEKLELVFVDSETASASLYGLVKKINAVFSEKKPKIVLIGVNTNKDYLLKASKNGISSFILKPYNSATVVKKTKSLFLSKANRRSPRLKIFDVIAANLIFEQHQFSCSLVDISTGGCKIKLKSFERKGIEIFDFGDINIANDGVDITIHFELIRVEQDTTAEDKLMLVGLKFKPFDQEETANFSKLWSTLVGHGKQE